jgi:hypothetical protein
MPIRRNCLGIGKTFKQNQHPSASATSDNARLVASPKATAVSGSESPGFCQLIIVAK